MKITDTVGRSMLVDLVYKDPKSGWVKAPSCTLKGRGTQFLRVPHGLYAIRICSQTGAEVIVHENGLRMIQVSVPARTQYVNNDSQGRAFNFAAPGEQVVMAPTDATVLADESAPAANPAVTADGAVSEDNPVVMPLPPAPIGGHGMVYVVVRFAREESPYSQPPQEEFELAFQMMEGEDFDRHFAENLHLVVQAPPLPNPLDPMSRTAPDKDGHDHRPSIKCVFSGCTH